MYRTAGFDFLRAGDGLRRTAGAWLDVVGLGPVATPARLVHAASGFELLAYADPGRAGPVWLLVPAPIKRAYIWDLAPDVSVVRRGLEHGLRVYLVRWMAPTASEAEFGLAEYADALLAEALAAIEAETGEATAVLAGHSLGGTLAAIFAALHPERVAALVLLEAPLHFGERGAGAFAPLLAAAPDTRLLTSLLGAVPGTFLDGVSVTVAPDVFLWGRWVDRLASAGDPRRLLLHHRVERWMRDELAMPGRLFEEVVETLYRQDRFMRGVLQLGRGRVGPDCVTAPLLAVVDPSSRIVPLASMLPFVHAAASVDKTVLHYEADRGVALSHVGVLVGPRAHRQLWPQIFDWVASASTTAVGRVTRPAAGCSATARKGRRRCGPLNGR